MAPSWRRGGGLLAGFSRFDKGCWEGAEKVRGGAIGGLTTPPPPRRDVFAALTIHVVARFVIEVRIRETLAFSVADGVGREASVGEGWRVPSL